MRGLVRSLRRGGVQSPIRRVTYKLTALAVSNIDGATGVGWGTVVLGDVPEGNVLIFAAALQATITEASANIIDTFSGNVSVGSAATADATLSAGEVDIIPSTAFGAAVASVATARAVSTATQSGTILDNTDGSLELNLNLLIADASIDADDQSVILNGTLTLLYAVLGDD